VQTSSEVAGSVVLLRTSFVERLDIPLLQREGQIHKILEHLDLRAFWAVNLTVGLDTLRCRGSSFTYPTLPSAIGERPIHCLESWNSRPRPSLAHRTAIPPMACNLRYVSAP